MNRDDIDEAPQYDRPSKSELKRRVEALQKAGESLIDLTPSQLAKMPLPDELRLAVKEAGNIRKKHAAFKRQRQYIGKLMREIDAEPILEALNDLESTHRTETSQFHEVEYWRDSLLGDTGADALTELLGKHPGLDVQMLRRQVAKAKREKELGRSRREQRDLFALLRGMFENS